MATRRRQRTNTATVTALDSDGSTATATLAIDTTPDVTVTAEVDLSGDTGPVLSAITLRSSNAETGLTSDVMRAAGVSIITEAVVAHLLTNGIDRPKRPGTNDETERASLRGFFLAQIHEAEAQLRADGRGKTVREGFQWTDDRLRAVAMEVLAFQGTGGGPGGLYRHVARWLYDHADMPTTPDLTAEEDKAIERAKQVLARCRHRDYLAHNPHGAAQMAGPALTDNDLQQVHRIIKQRHQTGGIQP